MAKKISLIIPTKNEEENLPFVFDAVNKVVTSLPQYEFENLIIDNCSEDNTAGIAMSMAQRDSRWKFIRFTRNFGSEASLDAGFQFATGDAVIVLFSDLQDPPSYIPEMLKKWEEGFDIVLGVYGGNKHESLWKRILVKWYYGILARVSDPAMLPFAADFRVYDRKVVDVLKRLREKNRYMRGLAQWVGFKSTQFEYERQPRLRGKSKAPPLYLFHFAFSVIVNFSDKPLRMFSLAGLMTMSVTFILSLILIANYFTGAEVVPGLTTTHVLLLFNIAFTSLGFGVVGEYISKIYLETKGRPLWIISESVGVDTKNKEIGL